MKQAYVKVLASYIISKLTNSLAIKAITDRNL
jgi:hypothetical protein